MGFFVKCMAGGFVAVVIAWIPILAIEIVKMNRLARQYTQGLYAVAGGWQYLLTSPVTALILGAAFGLGVYVTARLLART